jgi:vacuolar-type H+-ATPase subunit F/Vma7
MGRTPAARAWAIGDAPTVRGFELAGFHGAVAETAEAVRAAVRRAREAEARLAVITEQALALAPELLLPLRESVRPLLVAVPSLLGPAPGSLPGERVQQAVRRALGIPASASVRP